MLPFFFEGGNTDARTFCTLQRGSGVNIIQNAALLPQDAFSGSPAGAWRAFGISLECYSCPVPLVYVVVNTACLLQNASVGSSIADDIAVRTSLLFDTRQVHWSAGGLPLPGRYEAGQASPFCYQAMPQDASLGSQIIRVRFQPFCPRTAPHLGPLGQALFGPMSHARMW